MKTIQVMNVDLIENKNILVGSYLDGSTFKMQYVKSYLLVGNSLVLKIENAVNDFMIRVEGISIEGKQKFVNWLEKCNIEKM